jgi:hypothetical protein
MGACNFVLSTYLAFCGGVCEGFGVSCACVQLTNPPLPSPSASSMEHVPS